MLGFTILNFDLCDLQKEKWKLVALSKLSARLDVGVHPAVGSIPLSTV
jgi:hypothetical protein